jgi:CRISPR-associated protein Csb2
MTVLELSFPAGRYHATPWGRHVNEGTVEWPPSPWRILRALIATWYLKAQEIPEPVVRSLVEKLSVPPRFCLPRASTSHTRHFMPAKGGDKTKVFDTFIQLEEGSAIFVAWDVDPTDDERATLKTLAERLGYFGRAESLVVARVLENIPANVGETYSISAPLSEFESLPAKTELIRLLVPTSPAAYALWRDDFMAKALAALGLKPTAAQKKKLPQLPENIFSALHADTGKLQSAGWNLPPGALYVDYTRTESAFAPAAKPSVRSRGKKPTVARFALTSVVPPSITRVLAVGEQIHTVLCKESKGHPIFTGAGSEGHQHAHIFAESIDDLNAHITHITVFAPAGFDNSAIRALRGILWTWGFKRHELRLVLHAIGEPADFKDCALFGKARVWRSLTPFVSTRHAKTFHDGRPKMDASGWQVGSGPHDLLRLLALHPQGTAATIKQLDERDRPFQFGSRRLRSLQFQTTRYDGGGSHGNSSGNAFIITFPEPVSGPLALGYGAHFGLGLFVPAG